MRVQLQALATYCEERWVNKIGQGLSFGVALESLEGQESTGVRRDSRLNAEDRRQAAHRLFGDHLSALTTACLRTRP